MLLFESCAFVQATVPNVPMKVLKEMCLTAARLLQQGELTAADAELRLRRLSFQLTLGSLTGLLDRDHVYTLFLDPEQVSAGRLMPARGLTEESPLAFSLAAWHARSKKLRVGVSWGLVLFTWCPVL